MRDDHPHRAGTWDWITFLVTGPEKKLMAFQGDAMFVVELFDRRKQTVRCRAHGQERGQAAYEAAIRLAKQHDVTLQDLVSPFGQPETYPVAHLGSDGMKWPDYGM